MLKSEEVEARAAAELEMQVNLNEFRTTAASLRSVSQRLAQVVPANSEDDPVFEEHRLDLSLHLPDMTSAAWRTAQASEAAPFVLLTHGLVLSRLLARTAGGPARRAASRLNSVESGTA